MHALPSYMQHGSLSQGRERLVAGLNCTVCSCCQSALHSAYVTLQVLCHSLYMQYTVAQNTLAHSHAGSHAGKQAGIRASDKAS